MKQVIGVCTSDKAVASSIMDEIIDDVRGMSYSKKSTANSLFLDFGSLLSVKWIPLTRHSCGMKLTKVIIDDSVDDRFLQQIILPMCSAKKNIIKVNKEDFNSNDGLPF